MDNNETLTPPSTPPSSTPKSAVPARRSLVQIGPARPRITLPGPSTLRRWSAPTGPIDAELLARRYSREAQLALEGLIYLGVRWPFKLMATLVEAGRKWEDEYNRTTPGRRVPPLDED